MPFRDIFVIVLILAYALVFRQPGKMTWLADILVIVTILLTIAKFIWLAKKSKKDE